MVRSAYPAFLFLVDLHGDAHTVVPHRDGVVLRIDRDFHGVHVLVPLLVVSCVHQKLVEDLIPAICQWKMS